MASPGGKPPFADSRASGKGAPISDLPAIGSEREHRPEAVTSCAATTTAADANIDRKRRFSNSLFGGPKVRCGAK
jgi:hypothetical protein